MKKFLSLALALILMFSLVATVAAEGYIAVISKGEQHQFWQTVRKGCTDAAEKYGVDYFYYGPPSEADIALQVEALKNELAKGPMALALAALDTEAVLGELSELFERGIPVIGFDSGVPNAPEGYIWATASTNNTNAGALAADEIFKLEAFQAKLAAATPAAPLLVVVLTQDATSESVTSRTTGFVNKMRELVGVASVTGHVRWADEVADAPVVIDVNIAATPGDVDVTNAATAALNKEPAVVFCSNEGTVKGLLAATGDGSELASGGRFDGLIVAGFDAGAAQKNAVRQGWFVGSVTQDPYMIGFLAVELAYLAANGEPVADADTGAKWYTAANIDDPDIRDLVYD